MIYKIFETDYFTKKIKKSFKENAQAVLFAKLKSEIYPQLKSNPYYGAKIKKLKNYKPETWRYRIGDYRLFYSIDEKNKIISILEIDHRQDAY